MSSVCSGNKLYLRAKDPWWRSVSEIKLVTKHMIVAFDHAVLKLLIYLCTLISDDKSLEDINCSWSPRPWHTTDMLIKYILND